MKPRVILKTHSGVRRPGAFSVLVAKCTSPTHPGNQAEIAKKLAAEFQHVPSEDLGGAKLGERGAAFHFVWMAKPGQLGFLASNLFWSWKGHVIHTLSSSHEFGNPRDYLRLSPAEQLIFLKYYLEGDGAILVSLAQELISRGQLTERDLVQTDLVEQMFHGIWSQYLESTTNISERVGLRLKLGRQRYDTTTRRHKTYPHLVPLEDMGLLVRDKTEGQDVFSPVFMNGQAPLQTLLERFPTIWELESSIEHGELCAVIADAMHSEYCRFSLREDSVAVMRMVAESYHNLSTNGMVLHTKDAIADLCYAKMLSEDGILVTRSDIDDTLAALQTEYPTEVRFHVDRLGRPAYIVMANELVNELRSA